MAKKRYANKTTVLVSKSRVQIQDLLTDWGITELYFGTSIRGDGIGFSYEGRTYKWNVTMPPQGDMTDAQYDQVKRQRWRVMYMSLKMKLEVIASGNETFEDELLAKMCLPDGNTMSDFIKLPEIAERLSQSKMPKLLSGSVADQE